MRDYRDAVQLLPKEIRNHLTRDATALFVKVWNLMNKKERSDIWISDRAISICARVDIDRLYLAKQQLIDVGLLRIKPGKWPQDDPINICHQYVFAASDILPNDIDIRYMCLLSCSSYSDGLVTLPVVPFTLLGF